ncbi:alkaline phosphatase family protein [Chryseolinea sp. T2]|uniref:alkaline phosphatase family protein n=1 Tax=Chryseolinea sp. T2 TaxID=3129255 RepID=UPI003077C44B
MRVYLLALFLLFAAPAISQRKAVFIIVDGIPADVIEKLRPPVLQEIAGAEGYTRAYVGGKKGGYSESPTISAVGYNHVLTGTWTNKHNVWDNDIKEPNYHYQNMFRIASEANKNLTTAVFSTWLDNRTKLVGDSLPSAGNIHITYAFDGYELDTVRFPNRKGSKYISDIDDLVTEEAAKTIETKAPDLSWVYLEFTDDMGHAYGDSPQFYDAIKAADARIGKIWKAVQAREKQYGEEWLVVITTDHGRTAIDGKGHGGQSDRERTTWIVTNAKNTNAHFKSLPGATDIAPTILRHLNITIKDEVKAEMDGIPFIGKVAVDNFQATRKGSDINLTWTKVAGASGKADIYVTSGNNFKTGGKDEYRKVASVDIQSEAATFKLPAPTAGSADNRIQKVVLKTADNWCNTWVVGD